MACYIIFIGACHWQPRMRASQPSVPEALQPPEPGRKATPSLQCPALQRCGFGCCKWCRTSVPRRGNREAERMCIMCIMWGHKRNAKAIKCSTRQQKPKKDVPDLSRLCLKASILKDPTQKWTPMLSQTRPRSPLIIKLCFPGPSMLFAWREAVSIKFNWGKRPKSIPQSTCYEWTWGRDRKPTPHTPTHTHTYEARPSHRLRL